MDAMENNVVSMEDGRGFRSVCVRLWKENKVAVICAAIILVFALGALFAPVLTPYSYEEITEEQEEIAEAEAKAKEEEEKEKERLKKEKEKAAKEKARKTSSRSTSKSSGRKKTSALEKTMNSAANTIGREIGKSIVRGILGNLKR